MASEYKIGISEIERIRRDFPNRVPAIVLKAKAASSDLPDLPKSKFLIPSDLSVGQFIYVIRKQLKLSPEKALFIFVGSMLPPSNMLVKELYSAYKSEDGLLRMYYTSESTFG
jgi:GABA(A) receptor-associated protein